MNFIVDAPNISIDRMNDVSGQLVTPQNTLTIPHAAHNPTRDVQYVVTTDEHL